MTSKYFNNEKPLIEKIIKFIKTSAKKHEIEINKIALVGGWAKEVRKVKVDNKTLSLIELQTTIDNSDKYGGDVDFVLFAKEVKHDWSLLLSEQLNISIAENEKNGYVDIVLSKPSDIRYPGIEIT